MFLATDERVLEDIPVEELDAVLCKFYAELRRKDGEEYEPDSLAVMQASLDRHLKNVGRPYSILCDRQFQLFSKNSSDCQIWQSSEISSPNYFQIVQHVVLLHIQIPPYYGIGQIDGNWIFQPFFFTIFPNISILWKRSIFFSGGAVWL